MCSAPKAPKVRTPKYEKVDKYQAYKEHTRYDDFKAATGRKFDSSKDVEAFNEWLLKDQFDTEFNDESFMDAFNNLARDGRLTGSKKLDQNSREAQKFRRQYRKDTGTTKGWEGAYAYMNFDYGDDADLQRVYDEQYRINQEKYQQEAQDRMDEQSKMFIDSQKEAAEQNQKMMEEMMNQPIYEARQAALPTVQYQPKTPDPMPVAPAPPPAMDITPAPPPELVNVGNPMGIVKQSTTARSRSRQRTRGTASLT